MYMLICRNAERVHGQKRVGKPWCKPINPKTVPLYCCRGKILSTTAVIENNTICVTLELHLPHLWFQIYCDELAQIKSCNCSFLD